MNTTVFDKFDRLWIKELVKERLQRTQPMTPKSQVHWEKELTGLAITAGIIYGGYKLYKLIT